MKHLNAFRSVDGEFGWLQEYSRTRPAIFAAFLLLDWIAIAAGVALFYHFHNLPSFLAGSVLIGFGQHGLIVLGHEAVHFRVCASKRLNDFVGNLFCFMPLTLTVSSYRGYHLPHHRDPYGLNDPEVPIRKAVGKNFAPPFSVARGLKLWALSFVGGSMKEMYCLGTMLPRSTKGEGIFLALFWIGAAALAYQTSFAYLGLWFYASATTYISKLRIQAWFEHGLDGTDTNRYSLPNALYRLLMPHNIWVHYEHHKYASVPFYNLEKVRAMEAEPKIFTIPEMCAGLERASFYQPKDQAEKTKEAA